MTGLRSAGSDDFQRLLEFVRERDQARLPPERELADTLGMTRNRLRTGLRKLAAEGAIWRHVGKGTYLGAKPSARDDRQLQVAETTNPREIMEARIAIEPEIARLAAYNATGHDFADMRRRVEAMRSATQWEVWEQLDVEFHRTIANAAHNQLLGAMFDMITDLKAIWGRLRQGPTITGRVQQSTDEHALILQSLQDRDADRAAELMRGHLYSVRRSIFVEYD